MSVRINEVIAGTNGYGELSRAPLLNMAPGGQHGHQSDLRYILSSQDYISRQLICKVLRTPTLLKNMPNGQRYVEAIVQLFETYAQTWEGFTRTLTTATADTPISGSGEVFQSIAKTTRGRTEPVMGLPDKYNGSVTRLMEWWQQELLSDPDTQIANFYTRRDVSNMPTDHLADRYSCVALFFETDPTFQFPTKAWLVGNMFPLSSGEITARRDKTAEGELNQLSIPFAGYAQVGLGVDDLAMRVMRSMTISGTNPNYKPEFVGDMGADVSSVQFNYVNKVNRDSAEFIRPGQVRA